MTIPQKPFVAVRFDLPIKHHEQLRHLCVSEHRPASELLVDAVELLLRYHGPQPPVRVTPAEAEEQEVEIEQVVEIEQPDEQGAGA